MLKEFLMTLTSATNSKSQLALCDEILNSAFDKTEKGGTPLGNGSILASAFLARHALEYFLHSLWDLFGVSEVKEATMRAQLLCLGEKIDSSLALQYRNYWEKLSSFIHKRTFYQTMNYYDMSEMIKQISDLIDSIEKQLDPKPA